MDRTTTAYSDKIEGLAFYRTVWQTLHENFWDPTRLAWEAWEHPFDDVIDSIDSAKDYARKLVAALNDKYTKLVDREPPASTGAPNKDSVSDVEATVLEQNIGHLKITGFSEGTCARLSAELEKIKNCDGFLIDLRDHPGGLIDETGDCLELFIEQGAVVTIEERLPGGVKKRDTYLTPELVYRLDHYPDGSDKESSANRLKCMIPGKPIVLLIGPGTASASEMFAAALLDLGKERCIAIGSRTYGKGIMQATAPIEGCDLKYTFGRYLSPTDEWFGDGAQTVANGIRPNIFIKERGSREGTRAGYDYLLKKLGKTVPVRRAPAANPLTGLLIGLALVGAGAYALSRRQN